MNLGKLTPPLTFPCPNRSTIRVAIASIASALLILSFFGDKITFNNRTSLGRLSIKAVDGTAQASASSFLHTSTRFSGARSHAAPLLYDEAVMNKWGFDRPACTPGLDFLVANTSMTTRWICRIEGELSVVAAMRRVLEPGCREAVSGRNLVLDVGSNSGMYGLMAIAAGCPAIFFDPQPGCNKVVTGALLANGWVDKGLVVAGGLSETSGTVKASSAGMCDFGSGRFPFNVQDAGTADKDDVTVPTEPLATFIGPDTHILFMKVDTEGFEQRVLSGCMPYFEKRLIKHAVVEVTPGHNFWEKRGIDALDVATTFERIVRAGYSFTLLTNVAAAKGENVTSMTNPVAVREWVLKRQIGQVDVMLSLAW